MENKNKQVFLGILFLICHVRAPEYFACRETGALAAVATRDEVESMEISYKGRFFVLELPEHGKKEDFNSTLDKFIRDSNDEKGLLRVDCQGSKSFAFISDKLDQPGLPKTWTKFEAETPKDWWAILALEESMQAKTLHIKLDGSDEAEYSIS